MTIPSDNRTLFDIFDNWYAFPAGPVEDDIYSYWYEKSESSDYTPADYTNKKDKYILADFFKDQVAYNGKSVHKYNLKMLYFCCLMEVFYTEFPFFDKKNILSNSKDNYTKIIDLVADVKQLLSDYFTNNNKELTVENLIWLSHNLNLWHKYYSPIEYKKIPIDKMKMDATTFFVRAKGIA